MFGGAFRECFLIFDVLRFGDVGLGEFCKWVFENRINLAKDSDFKIKAALFAIFRM